MSFKYCEDISSGLTPEDEEALIGLKRLIKGSNNPEFLDGVGKMWASNDDILLRFIRARKYNTGSALQRITKFIHEINNHPEVFNTLTPSNLFDAFDVYGFNILKSRDDKGRHILFIKVDKWVDPNSVSMDELTRSVLILGWEMLKFKETQLNGLTIIVDGRGFSYKQGKQITPVLINRFLGIILKSSPMKIKAVHLIYAPTILSMTMSVIKMFLPMKLKQRIYVHGSSLETLHESISPKILPDWVGGHLTSEEAIDYELYNGVYTEDKDEYYRTLWSDNLKQEVLS